MKKKFLKGARNLFLAILIIIYCLPLLMTLNLSFKNDEEIANNSIGLPNTITLSNYIKAWNEMNFPIAFVNSAIITNISTAGIILIASMAAYGLLRFKYKINSFIFHLFLFSLMVPFQVFIFPLVIQTRDLGLNNIFGICLIYWGLGFPFMTIIIHRFLKDIPKEQEEEAILCGASPIQIFFKIVLPQLKSVIFTIAVLTGLYIWNDYLLPSLVLTSKGSLQLELFRYFKQLQNEYGPAAASTILASLPLIIFFILFKKTYVKPVISRILNL